MARLTTNCRHAHQPVHPLHRFRPQNLPHISHLHPRGFRHIPFSSEYLFHYRRCSFFYLPHRRQVY
ncbi:hypothetical protein HanRHA438_Chr16g0736271 [Helianthus annuus]|nr:hypothetical protein HanRHA438_Chr16g0736271 [Helianthus annuus]